MIRKLVLSFVACIFIVGLILGWFQLTLGFKLNKVVFRKYNDNFYDNRFEKGEPEQLKAILNQNFYFLGKGCQVYAFVSEDGQYVLKLLKLHRYQIPFRKVFGRCCMKKEYNLTPLYLSQKKRLRSAFVNYKLAIDVLKDETALIYAHFDPGFVMPKVNIKDRLNRKFQLDLNKTFFLVQKKVENFKDRLLFLKDQQNLEGAKLLIDQTIEHLKRRLSYKIFDSDHPGYVRNLGVLKEQTVSVDVGNFKQRKKASVTELEREYFSCVKKLQSWSEKKYPEIAAYIQEKYQGASK